MNVDITIPSQVVSADIPAAEIVYQNSWLGQTSGFSASIFTLPSDGQYRVSLSLIVQGNSGNTSVTGTVSYPVPSTGSGSWNQLVSQATSSLPSVPYATTGTVGSFVGVSGQSIPLSVSVSGGSINHYDLYVTVEKLQ